MSGICDQKQEEERKRECAFSKMSSCSALGACADVSGISHLWKGSRSSWTLEGRGLSESLLLKPSLGHPPMEI